MSVHGKPRGKLRGKSQIKPQIKPQGNVHGRTLVHALTSPVYAKALFAHVRGVSSQEIPVRF
jgi:hypothetical protein